MRTTTDDIHQFIVENFLFGIEESPLSQNASFIDTGIIDSTGVLELISYLENQYEIEILDEEIIPANLDSVAKLVAFVERKRAEVSPAVKL